MGNGRKRKKWQKVTSDLGMILRYVSLLCGVPELAILLLVGHSVNVGWGGILKSKTVIVIVIVMGHNHHNNNNNLCKNPPASPHTHCKVVERSALACISF